MLTRVNTYHGSRNLTIQWCLISESLHNSKLRSGHGFAASLGGVDTSYHHNLLANHAGRNPSIAGGDLKDPTIHLDFRNNVIFNWEYRVLDGRPHSINVVNNFYKSGPASRKTSKIIKDMSKIARDVISSGKKAPAGRSTTSSRACNQAQTIESCQNIDLLSLTASR